MSIVKNINSEHDIIEIIGKILKRNENENINDLFERYEENLLLALAHYVYEKYPTNKSNIKSIMNLIENEFLNLNRNSSVLDEIFERLEKEDKNSLAIYYYNQFKIHAPKITQEKVIFSLMSRLQNLV